MVIDATVPVAETAHSLDCHTFFVQQPGSPARSLVDDTSGYYSVDFTGDIFADFVDKVLRPLHPTAVVSVSAGGSSAAAVAGELLGTPGASVAALAALATVADCAHAAGAGARSTTAYTHTAGGAHRLVGLLPTPPVATGPPGQGDPAVSLCPEDQQAAERAVRDVLDRSRITHGPVRMELWLTADGIRVVRAEQRVDQDEAAVLHRLTGVDLVRQTLDLSLAAGAGGHTAPTEALDGSTR
ncbi:hypothetical protein B7R87_30320 [Streptomyces tsukubensis]|nr:hypothetical protein B7R87_30320 [Streptomyces tsukubensis]